MNEIQTLCANNDVTIIRERAKYTEAKRKDGLVIFLDHVTGNDVDKELLTILNHIRVSAAPQEVVMAVGMIRGIQIARGYAEKFLPESVPEIINTMKAMLKGHGYKRRMKKLKALNEVHNGK